MSIDDRIATPEGKRRYVRSLFATIADRYDLITVAAVVRQDRRWKRRLVALARPASGMRALDLATGTGDIAFALSAARARGRRTRLTDADDRARATQGHGSRCAHAFLVGDMTALPFAGSSFDLVTTGYGLRNVPDLTSALDEMLRVLKPGGQALSLDFNRPSHPVVRAAYLAYLSVVGGILGWLLHRDPDTYRYIPASIRAYPGAEAVARLMETRGFARVTCYPCARWPDGHPSGLQMIRR